ncbi:MAG: flagellar hook-basal body complex protein FliE [Bacillota bacterium]|nr:flagellar hook-basal body complex protein FliE [Bacillota bacterium]
MQITQIPKIDLPAESDKSFGVSLPGDNPFQDMFRNAINGVKSTDSALNAEIAKVATGQTDDLHSALIASQKASLSVELLVELRNQALDAYKEIMNTGI